jgi:hypothetical protein
MDAPFGQWWDDPIKHAKRTAYWVPIAREAMGWVKNKRVLKYFTLCSREMIDVFALVKEGILKYDKKDHRLDGVFFCETEEQIVPEIKEMLGFENSGVMGKLEDVVLFEDDAETDIHATVVEIDKHFDTEGESIPAPFLERLKQKRKYLVFQNQFPFDFLNLDFCDKYYQDPPDTLKISKAVRRIMQWQSRVGIWAGAEYSVKKFAFAVTCRFAADEVSGEAFDRLALVLKKNMNDFPSYSKAVGSDGDRKDTDGWKKNAPLDFFLAVWPKELMKIAEQEQWRCEMKTLLHYERTGGSGKNYRMISLICECTRDPAPSIHEVQSLWLLDRANHKELLPVDETKAAGKALLDDLEAVVEIRNEQAKRKQRELLPAPRRKS